MMAGFVNPEYERRMKKIEQRLDVLVDRFRLSIDVIKGLAGKVEFNTDEIAKIGLDLEEEKFRE